MAKLKKDLEALVTKLRIRIGAVLSLLVIVSLVAVVGVAVAYSSGSDAPKVVIENGNYIEAQAPVPAEEFDKNLSAVSGPFLNGPDFGVGMDKKFSVSSEMADATTTFSYAVPFRAATTTAGDIVVETITSRYGYTVPTTTVELVRINVVDAPTSTTYQVGCGSSASKFTTTTQSIAILNSDSVPADFVGVIENGLATGAGAMVGGGSVTKIMVGPSHPYVVCRIYAADANEFTVSDNEFEANIALRMSVVQ